MLARTFTTTIVGLQPVLIEVEVVTATGIPTMVVIGLPSKAIDEAKERITSALKSCDIKLKNKRTIINLAPADLKKHGSHFELAIVVGLLQSQQIIKSNLNQTLFFGELSLDGSIKAIKGALPLIINAHQLGFKEVFFPQANANELPCIPHLKLLPIHHLQELINHYCFSKPVTPFIAPSVSLSPSPNNVDLSDIRGQYLAKRALEIAAAGNHNLLMIGPPGAGKSMLAQSLSSLLPALDSTASIRVSSIHSIAGEANRGLITQPPFRSPDKNCSLASLLGGGPNLKPGEVSLADQGVLFLDELLEFPRWCLESLRQPMETHVVTLNRVSGTVTYPAHFQLVAASNPCPCGYYGSSQKPCTCTPNLVTRYQQRLSGPILDRIDIHIRVNKVELTQLSDSNFTSEGSTEIKKRVSIARNLQLERYKLEKFNTNAAISSKDIARFCPLSQAAQTLLNKGAVKLDLSARAYFKTIKVARTIADLAKTDVIEEAHIGEALQLRNAF